MSGPSSQQFCVRWNSHLGSLGAAFPQLLSVQRFVDVTLACEGHQLHCHRLLLAACSSYFESLLADNPCEHPIIILPHDIKLWMIQALIDFMYKGEVNVSQDGLPELLKCAEILQIRGLYGADNALNFNATHNNITVGFPKSSFDHNQQQEQNENNFSQHSINTSGKAQSTLSGSNSNNNSQSQQQHKRSRLYTKSETHDTSQRSTRHPHDESSTNLDTSSINQGNTIDSGATTSTPLLSKPKIEEEELNGEGFDEDVSSNNDGKESTGDISDFLDNLSKSGSPLANVLCEYENSLRISDGSTNSRVRRSEALLQQAAECVSKGQTFKTVSDMFNIPISTIRFYMARKGILPRRKRGRAVAVSTTIFNDLLGANKSH